MQSSSWASLLNEAPKAKQLLQEVRCGLSLFFSKHHRASIALARIECYSLCMMRGEHSPQVAC